MAITPRTSGALAVHATTGPITPALPAGTVEADVLHLSVRAHSASATPPTIPTPTNWVLLQTGTVVRGGTESVRHSVFRRVVPAGGVSAPSVSSTGADGTAGVVSGYAGADITTPEDVAVPAASTGAALTPLPAPGVTTVTDGALVASYYNQLDNRVLSAPNNGASLLYGGSGYATLTGSDTCMAGATKAMPTAGASGTTSITSDAPQVFEYVNITVAIRPASTLQDKAVADTLTVGVDDTSALVKHVPKDVTDTLTLGITEAPAAVGVPIPKDVTDTLALGVAEGAPSIARITTKDVTDTLALGITDTSVRHTIGPTYGTWTSPPKVLPEDLIAGSVILWDATLPPGTSLSVETSIDNAATWQAVSNRGPVARTRIGSTAPKAVLVRATLTKTVPEDQTPELHRLEMRIARDSSVDEYCQLGRFFLDDTEVVDNGAGLVLRLIGSDLSRRVSMNTWDETLIIDEGTNARDAIVTIISNRWPDATFNLASTELTTTRMFFGEGVGAGNPWADAQKVARDVGWELFLDAFGVVTSRAVPDPDVMPAVWTVTDSARPTMIDLSRRMTNANTYNQVIVFGESSSNDVPVTARWRDDDPTSRTYWGGRYGKVTKTIRSDRIRDETQAQLVADAEGLRVKGATEIVRMSLLVCPFLEPGDVIEVDREFSKTTGRFAIDGWHIPLGPQELMTMDMRRQRQ